MKRLFLTLLHCIVFASCSDTPTNSYATVCSCLEKERAANFVASSIKNANNMSDEEMEDVIIQLERTSYDLFCSKKNIQYYYKEGNRSIITELDSCQAVIF